MSSNSNNFEELFTKLAKSKFRSRFKLTQKDRDYLEQKGLTAIEQHAHDFILERLAPASPKNDGKQTPMKNHPVFIAQHATGTCCRKCLNQWHNIKMGKELTSEEVEYIIGVVMEWIKRASDRGKV